MYTITKDSSWSFILCDKQDSYELIYYKLITLPLLLNQKKGFLDLVLLLVSLIAE